jgi:hypothetical protein
MIDIVGIIKRLPRTLLNNFLKIFFRKYSNPLEFLNFKKDLQENKRFKNIHKGEICFIVGNGPSIKKQDLNKIKGENIFVVNSFPYTKLYEEIYPQFFVIWDDVNFDWENENFGEYRLNLFRKVAELNPDTKCIFPVKFKDQIENKNIFENKNILYAYYGSSWDKNESNNFDFEKQLPFINNVIDLAIMSAMYMGFTKIYLLGVDMTDFLAKYEYSWDQKLDEKYEHFYDHTEEERKVIDYVAHLDSSNEARLRVAADKLMILNNIGKVAKANNIEIVNMTEGGGLDVFSRMKYDDYFKKKI